VSKDVTPSDVQHALANWIKYYASQYAGEEEQPDQEHSEDDVVIESNHDDSFVEDDSEVEIRDEL